MFNCYVTLLPKCGCKDKHRYEAAQIFLVKFLKNSKYVHIYYYLCRMKVNKTVSLTYDTSKLAYKLRSKGVNISSEVEKLIIALAKKHKVK